ncbi:MAG: hypothetical protein KF745_00620 [Phycisphaeraceae bacterium]|nr:hypothetical protein [Phycisphaeraceae bacterium]
MARGAAATAEQAARILETRMTALSWSMVRGVSAQSASSCGVMSYWVQSWSMGAESLTNSKRRAGKSSSTWRGGFAAGARVEEGVACMAGT